MNLTSPANLSNCEIIKPNQYFNKTFRTIYLNRITFYSMITKEQYLYLLIFKTNTAKL